MLDRIGKRTYGTVDAAERRAITGLAFVRGIADGTLPMNTIAQTLGYDVTEADAGRVVIVAYPNATLLNPAGEVKLAFHIEDVYTPPVWPSQPGKQIIMEHLDIRVDDLPAACAHAQACGARLADYQPQETVRVHLDPDGHIFCLYLDE